MRRLDFKTMKFLTFSLIAALGVAALSAPFASAQDAAPPATNLISNGNFDQDAQGWTYRYLRTQNQEPVFVAATPTEGITKAFHAEVIPEETLKSYSMTIGQPLSKAVKVGETFKLSFWARSPQSSMIAALLGTVKPSKTSFFYKRFNLTPEWKQYEFEAVGKENLPAREALVEFHCAFTPGEIELTGVEVTGEADAAP